MTSKVSKVGWNLSFAKLFSKKLDATLGDTWHNFSSWTYKAHTTFTIWNDVPSLANFITWIWTHWNCFAWRRSIGLRYRLHKDKLAAILWFHYWFDFVETSSGPDFCQLHPTPSKFIRQKMVWYDTPRFPYKLVVPDCFHPTCRIVSQDLSHHALEYDEGIQKYLYDCGLLLSISIMYYHKW